MGGEWMGIAGGRGRREDWMGIAGGGGRREDWKKPHKKAFKLHTAKKKERKKKTSKRKRIQKLHVNISPTA